MKIEFTDKQLQILREEYAKIQKIDPCGATYPKMVNFLDNLLPDTLRQIAGANIKWLSPLAKNRLPACAEKLDLSWKPVPGSLPNLHVLRRGAAEVGFIEKPKDDASTRNAWRCFAGIGEHARLLGHHYSKIDAMKIVEIWYKDGGI